MLQQKLNLGQRFGISRMNFSPEVAYAAVHSKAVVLLLMILCLLLLPLWNSVIVIFCCALPYVNSSFAIILMLKRNLVALLCLSSCVL